MVRTGIIISDSESQQKCQKIGAIQQGLVQHFEDIKYLRAERTKKHLLADILLYYTYQLLWLGK